MFHLKGTHIMRRILLLPALLLSVLSGLWSCGSDPEPESTPFFTLEAADGTLPSTIGFGKQASSESFTVKSNANWTLSKTGNAAWLTIDPDRGSGNGRITFSAEINTTGLPRSETVEIAADGTRLHTLTVRQEALEFDLEITPAAQNVYAAGGDVAIEVKSSLKDWEYRLEGGNWLREKSRTASRLTFTALSNPSSVERTLTVVFSSPSFPGIEKKATVTQKNLSADLLDVVFQNDGSARDISPMRNTVNTVSGASLTTYYNEGYGRYTAKFMHAMGEAAASGYYRVDYSSNQQFKDGLADGHSFEAVLMAGADLPSKEIKPFCATEGGGTGLMLATDGQITFLPHVGGNWVWTKSGVVPQKGRYYHVVGVWSKAENKSRIYIDGQLKATVSTSGAYDHPAKTNCQWVGIGVDAGSSGQSAWNGDVVLARIYNTPLNDAAVRELYDLVRDKQPVNTIELSDIMMFSTLDIAPGDTFPILGKGFRDGDRIRLESTTDEAARIECDITIGAKAIRVKLPADFASGKYRVVLLRGTQTYPLGSTELNRSPKTVLKAPEDIAHRGYHQTPTVPHNSIASLKRAQELNSYGSEADFWITQDGRVVVYHDRSVNGIVIEDALYSDLRNVRLSNGEALPTLEAFLDQLKAMPASRTKLIIEIKSHSTNARTKRAVEAIAEAVAERGLENKVEYIAFSYQACLDLVAATPEGTMIGYLNGDRAPRSLHDKGIMSIDYAYAKLLANKQWIREAQELGMIVNVWTVNSSQDMLDFIGLGVDYITTDYPQNLQSIIEAISE